MEIRYKLYPYPVLSNYSDDYINSTFDSVIEVTRKGYNIVTWIYNISATNKRVDSQVEIL